jgi:hypothetical protein
MDNYQAGADTFNEFYWYAAGPEGATFGSPHGGNWWGSGDFFEPGPNWVGYFGENAMGVTDASGNAWEWMSDTFAPGDLSTWALHGGSWYNHEDLLSTDQRFPVASGGYADVSFRVVCGVDAVFQIEVTTDGGARDTQRNYQGDHEWVASRVFRPELTPSTDYTWEVRMIHPGLSTPGDSPGMNTPEVNAFSTTDQVEKNITVDLAADWNLIAVDNDPTQLHPEFLFGFESASWAWSNEFKQYFKPFEITSFDGLWLNMDAAVAEFAIDGFTPASILYKTGKGWNLFGPLDHDSVLDKYDSLRGVVFYYDPAIRDYEQAELIRLKDDVIGDGVVPTGIMLKHKFAHWLFAVEAFEIDFSTLPEREDVEVIVPPED